MVDHTTEYCVGTAAMHPCARDVVLVTVRFGMASAGPSSILNPDEQHVTVASLGPGEQTRTLT